MKEEWLLNGAVVPVDVETTAALVAEIHRLIDVVGGMALAQPEPVKIAHKHEWFRTGEMKVGQMRCISCGTWGQEEAPQRTWVGLTQKQIESCYGGEIDDFARAIEAKLKEKNT